VITIDRLTKHYGKTVAVDDLSFEVLPGRVTGFLGPNGAGKSTTLRTVLGLDTPTSGRALIDGKPYRAMDRPRTRVGALLDASAVHPGLQVRTHLEVLALSNAIPAARVPAVLERVGLPEAGRTRIRALSLGMRQRLGIAAALLGDPQVLLFDEPLNGLDPQGVAWARTLIRALAQEGRTILVSSHLMSEMALTADHLVVIGRGHLVADLSTADFIASAARSDLLVRTPAAPQLATLLRTAGAQVSFKDQGSPDVLLVQGHAADQIGALAAGAGIEIHELSHRQPSLEEAYLSLTDQVVEHRAETRTHPLHATERDAR
jgi:ABC-2 type transport system ATP-binding protein